MSNIQSGINQFISKAAILGRLAPGFEERQENYKLDKEEKVLGKEYDQSLKGLKESKLGNKEFEQSKNTIERMIDLYERKFQNKPTKENYEMLLNTKKNLEEGNELYEIHQSIKRGKEYFAKKEQLAKLKAAQQLNQKMIFDDFKKQLTVKDLPQNLQERAYNEYTSKE